MKLINGRKRQEFYIGDRALLRDKRIKADAKNIYHVLCSLSETCDSVFPSHAWLASEIGYNTDVIRTDNMTDEEYLDIKDKKLKAIQKWVKEKLDELESINLIKVIKRVGYTNEYIVLDYEDNTKIEKIENNPPQKSRETPHKKVGETPHKKVGEETRIEKQENRIENFSENEIVEVIEFQQRINESPKQFENRIENYKKNNINKNKIYEIKYLQDLYSDEELVKEKEREEEKKRIIEETKQKLREKKFRQMQS